MITIVFWLALVAIGVISHAIFLRVMLGWLLVLLLGSFLHWLIKGRNGQDVMPQLSMQQLAYLAGNQQRMRLLEAVCQANPMIYRGKSTEIDRKIRFIMESLRELHLIIGKPAALLADSMVLNLFLWLVIPLLVLLLILLFILGT